MSEINWSENMLKTLLHETRAALERETKLADGLAEEYRSWRHSEVCGSKCSCGDSAALAAWRAARGQAMKRGAEGE